MLDYITRIDSSSVERKAQQMKPHLNSEDPDFFIDLPQIAHTPLNMNRNMIIFMNELLLDPPPNGDPHQNLMGFPTTQTTFFYQVSCKSVQ